MSSVAEFIEKRLSDALAPVHLSVINESHMHNVPPNSQTHFKVVVASAAFTGQRQVARQQRIYGLLNEVLRNPVHALALHTYTPEEWAIAGAAPASPACVGGEKRDAD